jgi:CheY-like chemotaxis protein/HPt (histidine-containing phosphotransfer) domain-containing protein
VRLEDPEIRLILDELDAQPEPPLAPGGETRTADRFSYRVSGLIVHLQHPGAQGSMAYRVPSRNISAEGLGFLHGGFIHQGTHCRVQLVTTYGTWNDTDGVVVYCRHVKGNLHEVGIRFETPIDPSLYTAAARHTNVLLVEDDNSIARLARHHLELMNAEVTHVGDGEKAVAAAMARPFDLILMDLDLPVLDGISATKQLRAAGYSGTIVASTAMTEAGDQQRCIEAGCDRYIPKPYTRDDLLGLLDLLRQEPLVSTLYDDPSMRDLIHEYVAELPSKARALEAAMLANDREALQRLARTIKGEGSSYGYEVITKLARDLENLIRSPASNEEVRKLVGELSKLCLLANASGRRSVVQKAAPAPPADTMTK